MISNLSFYYFDWIIAKNVYVRQPPEKTDLVKLYVADSSVSLLVVAFDTHYWWSYKENIFVSKHRAGRSAARISYKGVFLQEFESVEMFGDSSLPQHLANHLLSEGKVAL